MAKEKKEKKGFFKEFGEFISRGNVLDMAVGVIIGGAFTAIVTALTNNILKPIINWILAAIIGANGLDGVYTFLRTAYVLDESGAPTNVIDLANSIFIDWGTFINAIINFLLTALILFLIIKTINHIRRKGEEYREALEKARAEREAEQQAQENGALSDGSAPAEKTAESEQKE